MSCCWGFFTIVLQSLEVLCIVIFYLFAFYITTKFCINFLVLTTLFPFLSKLFLSSTHVASPHIAIAFRFVIFLLHF